MTLPFAALSGFLLAMPWPWLLLGVIALALALGFTAAPIAAWTVAGAVLVVGTLGWSWLAGYLVVMTVFNVPALRVTLVSGPVMRIMKALKFLPVISETE
ncbi:MAG: acyl-CoA dehydrogenase, partial [Planctomycetota bacterium]|nr:acyl-CoA dehydrogenase [Planctomycetota bacterium]